MSSNPLRKLLYMTPWIISWFSPFSGINYGLFSNIIQDKFSFRKNKNELFFFLWLPKGSRIVRGSGSLQEEILLLSLDMDSDQFDVCPISLCPDVVRKVPPYVRPRTLPKPRSSNIQLVTNAVSLQVVPHFPGCWVFKLVSCNVSHHVVLTVNEFLQFIYFIC